MLSKAICLFVAGEALIDQLQVEKDAKVRKSERVAGCYDSESLCQWQGELSRRGILGVELVKSIYGYTVRYDSGLQNFGIVASCRFGQLDGTLAGAEEFARNWVAQDPTRRYAWVRK